MHWRKHYLHSEELNMTDTPAVTLQTTSVLYVEDDQISREALQDFLQSQVGTLHVASNALEGFDLYEKYFPDVLITDIQMSEMNGFELIRAIKSINPDVLVIVISAYNDQNYQKQAAELNVDCYLQKPIDLDELLSTLQQNLPELSTPKIEQPDAYTRFLLDSNPRLMVEIAAMQVRYINQPLLDFLGLDSMETYLDHHLHFAELLCNEDGTHYDSYALENWLHFLLKGSGMHNDLHFSVDKTRSFSLKIYNFDKTDRCLIEFIPREILS